MRLWHYELIPYLPKQQLLGQWRELNSIFVKEDKHILINFIYNYHPTHLLAYSQAILREMVKRGYRFNLEKYNNYFKSKGLDDEFIKFEQDEFIILIPFERDMNFTYLKICCWNLFEKHLCGQEGFTKKTLAFIKRNINFLSIGCFTAKKSQEIETLNFLKKELSPIIIESNCEKLGTKYALKCDYQDVIPLFDEDVELFKKVLEEK